MSSSNCSIVVIFKTVLFLILFLLILLTLSPIIFFRFILSHLTRILRPDLGNILPAQSAFHASFDQDTQHLANVLIHFKLNGNFNYDYFVRTMESNLIQAKHEDNSTSLLFPEFQQHCVSFAGFPFWKWDHEFKLRDHIYYKGELKHSEQINAVQKRMLEANFEDPYKSPWNVEIWNHKEANCHHFVFKFSHAIADGFGLFNSLLHCADNRNDDGVKPKCYQQGERRKSNILKLLLMPYDFSKIMHEISQTLPILSVPVKHLTKERHFWTSKSISNNLINKIRKSKEVSFSAVVFAAVTGGVRNYLLKLNNNQVQQYITSVAPFPVSEHPKTLTNLFGLAFINLPIGVEDPIVRVKMLENSLQWSRNSAYVGLTSFINTVNGSLPFKMQNSKSQFPPIMLSNFPGPKEQIIFDGNEVVEAQFSIFTGFAISMCCLTYNGHLKIVINSDQNVIPSEEKLHELGTNIELEFDNLFNLQDNKQNQTTNTKNSEAYIV